MSKIEWIISRPRWWLFCAGLWFHRVLPKGLAGKWALDIAAWASVPFVRSEQEQTSRLLPAHVDCPTCPGCGWAGGTPIQVSHRAYDYAMDGHTLYCPACGHGWVGSLAEVVQAVRAYAAWWKHPQSGHAQYRMPLWLRSALLDSVLLDGHERNDLPQGTA